LIHKPGHSSIRRPIRKEIEDVRADTAIPQSEKGNLLEELKAALEAAEPIQFPSNIELVKKYYDKPEATNVGILDYASRSTSSVRRTSSE